MTDQRTTAQSPSSSSGHVGQWSIAALALVTGAGIAWVDTRPSWDDTGVTAGSLLVAAGLAAVAGLAWWRAALLVAIPILLAELPSTGWGILASLAFTTAGSLLGAAVRRAVRLPPRTR